MLPLPGYGLLGGRTHANLHVTRCREIGVGHPLVTRSSPCGPACAALGCFGFQGVACTFQTAYGPLLREESRRGPTDTIIKSFPRSFFSTACEASNATALPRFLRVHRPNQSSRGEGPPSLALGAFVGHPGPSRALCQAGRSRSWWACPGPGPRLLSCGDAYDLTN